MTEDSELLAHYIARGREPWNVSLEAAWLDYELRRYVLSRLPAQVFAEAAFSSLVNIHEATAIAEMAAPAAGVPTCDPAIALLIHVPAPADAVNDSINEHAILRL